LRSLGQLQQIIDEYNVKAPLEDASTIPASWYTDEQLYELELNSVFASRWQMVARADQLREPGRYVTAEIGGEPILIVRGSDNILRGFFNVCRHHAAAVMTEPEGTANQLRCPYHGWTYSLEGELKGTPDFAGVCNFDKAGNGLVPIEIAGWEKWIFARLERDARGTGVPPVNPSTAAPGQATRGTGVPPVNPSTATPGQDARGTGVPPVNPAHGQDARATSLDDFLGTVLLDQIRSLNLGGLHWMERRHYSFDCNWKVFVDNYLDGGYHVPYLHKGLDSVLDYSKYTIENGEHFCLQRSPIVSLGAEAETGAVRKGDHALYYWLYPNFMINHYDGVMDTNLVIPRGLSNTEVIFDFYFPDVTDSAARTRNRASIEIGERIQDEDVSICRSVQRGLKSRSYNVGRLSVRREAGEQLFHRLLYSDLKRGCSASPDVSGLA
jgi:choline monooxygenase